MLTRDWALKNRSFVFDLSPWGDEKPQDDPEQRVGLDLETCRLVLAEMFRQSAGKRMTELTGFFVFSKYANMPDHKSAHELVPTEWERPADLPLQGVQDHLHQRLLQPIVAYS